MNTPKINYVAVGAFVSVILVGLVVAVSMLTGRTGAMDAYYATYTNVTGVKFGTQVFYEGYPIGQVTEVTPVPEGSAMRFRVDLEVTEGWRIPEDTVARIGANGLLSAITINMEAGQSDAALTPGAEVIAGEARDLFKVMSNVAGEVSDLAQNDVKPLLSAIRDSVITLTGTINLVDDLVAEDGKRVITTFAQVADDLSVVAPRITKNLDQGSADFAQLAKDLNDTRAKLDGLLAGGDAMIGDNREAVAQAVKDLEHVADSLARHIDSFNQNLDGTARNLYEFSREIRQNPGALLSSSAPQDAGR